jgi:hypothetical protein
MGKTILAEEQSGRYFAKRKNTAPCARDDEKKEEKKKSHSEE